MSILEIMPGITSSVSKSASKYIELFRNEDSLVYTKTEVAYPGMEVEKNFHVSGKKS